MTHIVDGDVIVLAPKERHHIELFAKSEHVRRRRLSLALGNYPMFDAYPLAGARIGPPDDVARGKYARHAGLEILVHRYSAVYCETRLLSQEDRGPYTRSDNHKIRVDTGIIVQRNLPAVHTANSVAQVKPNSV